MNRRSMARIAVSGAVLAALGMGVPQAVQAHTVGARFAPAVNIPSTTQAGYVLASAPTPASAGDKFRVPTLTCPSTGNYGIAQVAFLSTSSGLTGGEVTAECSSGTASYTGFVWENNEFVTTPFTPAAGDLIQATATETATTANGFIRDITQNIADGFSNSVGATTSSVLVGMTSVTGSSGTLPIPPFGIKRFFAGTIDGGTVLASGAVAENMRTSTHVLQIKTSALNSAGTVWREVFKHS